jgi:phosphatidylglycerol:prolipoprotein diacylglycerol transferase
VRVLAPHNPALHPLFECLGYVAAFALYKRTQSKHAQSLPSQLQPRQLAATQPAASTLHNTDRWSLLAAAALGALLGSRLLGVLEHAPQLGLHWQLFLAPGGKTIVGGLLGGWLFVELAKRLLHIHTRTGDPLAIPLCLGIAIGRIGCFFTGLADDTYGKPSHLPWAVNFGDGIPRHPTQLYELFFLFALAAFLHWRSLRPHAPGTLFRQFLTAYLLWRVLIDFLKPQPVIAGLNLIQWSCLAGLIALALTHIRQRQRHTTAHPSHSLTTATSPGTQL